MDSQWESEPVNAKLMIWHKGIRDENTWSKGTACMSLGLKLNSVPISFSFVLLIGMISVKQTSIS